MKKYVIYFLFLFVSLLWENLSAQNIPDANFAAAIASQCPTCIDGSNNLLPPAASLTTLDVSNYSIANLTGIMGFSSLLTFNCSNIDFSGTLPTLPSSLQTLDCSMNSYLSNLGTLPSGLQTLNCGDCYSLSNLGTLPSGLLHLNFSNSHVNSLSSFPTGLLSLDMNYNYGLTNLPPLPNTLTSLSCEGAELQNLGSLPISLTHLNCSHNELNALTVAGNGLLADLSYFDCSYNGNITSIPLAAAMPNLLHFSCGDNQISTIPLSMPNVTFFSCFNNQITNIPTLMPNVTFFDCSNNQITAIPSNMPNLVSLYCNDNMITTLPVAMPLLERLYCYNNQIAILPTTMPNVEWLYCQNNPIGTNFPANLPTVLTHLNCGDNQLSSLPTLPNTLESLICNNNQLTSLPILSTVLMWLDCRHNLLTSLPALPNTLEELQCSYNQLTSLPTLPNLYQSTFDCSHNLLTTLPSFANTNISYELNCSYNQLTSLPSAMPAYLYYLNCSHNQLSSLPTLPNSLVDLYCQYNQFTHIPSLSNLTNLYGAYFGYNNLTLLETSQLPVEISWIDCSFNPNLTCTETLPANLFTLAYSGSPIVCVPNIPANANITPASLPICTSPCSIQNPLTISISGTSSNSISVCAGTTVTLTASSTLGTIAEYLWYKNGVAVNYQNGGNGTYTVNAGTSAATNEYSVQVVYTGTSTLSAMSAPVTIITAAPEAIITPNGPTTFCSNTPTTLQANIGVGYSYIWRRSNTIVSVGGTSYIPTLSGNYNVTVTDANGCSKTSAWVNITRKITPNANAGTDKNLCIGSSVQIGTNPLNSYTYSWYPNSSSLSNPTVSPSNTTTYHVVVTSINGCIAEDEVIVTVNALPPTPSLSISPSPVCQGTSIIMIPSSTGVSNDWYKNGTLLSSNIAPTAGRTLTAANTNGIADIYTICAKNGAGCLSSPSNAVSALIYSAPTPTITSTPAAVGQIITVCVPGGTSGSATLTANSPAATYAWKQGANYIAGATNSSYIATVTTTANNRVISVEATYPNGCIRTSSAKKVKLVTSGCTPRMGEEKEGELINLSNEAYLTVYPNPTNTLLTLNIDNLADSEANVLLYNSIGQLVLTESIIVENGKVAKTIDLSTFAKGMYSLVFQTASGKWVQKVMRD